MLVSKRHWPTFFSFVVSIVKTGYDAQLRHHRQPLYKEKKNIIKWASNGIECVLTRKKLSATYYQRERVVAAGPIT